MPNDASLHEKIGQHGAAIDAVLRELGQTRTDMQNTVRESREIVMGALREQDRRLMAAIDDKFGVKFEACEGLEGRIDDHETRLRGVEIAEVGRMGVSAVRQRIGRLVEVAAIAITGAFAALAYWKPGH